MSLEGFHGSELEIVHMLSIMFFWGGKGDPVLNNSGKACAGHFGEICSEHLEAMGILSPKSQAEGCGEAWYRAFGEFYPHHL